jgi:hypothetical protein
MPAEMQISSNVETRICAVCGRSLLTGERPVRYAPTGSSSDYVDVCLLCQEIAVESGWIKEGSPTTPIVAAERKRRRKLGLGSLFERRRATPEQPVASEPILRRLSEHELAIVEAADLFNASAFRRTIAGIAKSLGEPNASVIPLSGVNPEVAITIAWDLSWYQYRVTLDAAQPVRLEERGHELAELEAGFDEWNAHLEDDGRLVPQIARL